MKSAATVAFVVNSMRFGGAEKHALQLFNGLPASRFRVAMAYLKREEHLLSEADQSRGPVWCGDFGTGWDFAALNRLTAWVINVQPDVLVCVNAYPLFYGHLVRRFSRLPCRVVEVFHSTELPAREGRQMRWVYRHFFNRSDHVVFVSEAQRAYWGKRGIRPDLSLVIHNGVDAEHFQDCYSPAEKIGSRQRFGFAADDFVVGICAALRPEKQHEDLVEATARLRSAGVPAKCLIIGDGPRRSAIEEKIAGLGLTKDIAITGFQADVRPFIAACDSMAIVSRSETLSIAALESMALGKPMVMSAIGGAAEMVRDGDNGYLFPAGDVEALVRVLRRLSDPIHRASAGARARALVEREFGLDTMLARYSQLLGSACGQ